MQSLAPSSGAPAVRPNSRSSRASRCSSVPPNAAAAATEAPPVPLVTYSHEVLSIPGVVDVPPRPESKVVRDDDGYWNLKPGEKAGNPFEKLKLARDPLKHLLHLGEIESLASSVATSSFEAVDKDKEAEVELDQRLKWLGFFHKRKHHYGRFMMRLKLPGGIVTSEQTRYLASVIAKYGDDGCADITTRQNFQLRGITVPDMPAILAGCQALGMTSVQSGLDNVRNAVGNPLAGIDPDEIIDTRPMTHALHAYVVNEGRGNPEISNLPRKWNVAVVGSHELWEHPHINDLAYLPAIKDGVMGFNIIVGGFISVARSAESVPLDAWVPTGEAVVSLCHAVLSVFRDYGARGNRQKSRMMWLVDAMGVEGFRAEVAARMPTRELARAAATDLVDPNWERRSYFGVQPQKQPGLSWVGVNVPGGRLDAEDMVQMADLADKYGSSELRLTVEQNFIIPNVPNDKTAALLAEPLLQKYTAFPGKLMAGLVACTGNQFCGFSQIETKQTAWRVAEELESVLDLPRDIRMMWTGCPNSCGQVQVADIGMMGCQVKNLPGQLPAMVPGVDVFVGGRVGVNSHLAEVTHPSVRMDDLVPLLTTVLVDTFGAKVKATPSPNAHASSRFRIAVKESVKTAPKGTPKKAGNATHICLDCGYIYNMVAPFDAQPEDFACPACGAPKSRFKPLAQDQVEPPLPAGALKGMGTPIVLTLAEKEVLSSDTRRFRFSLPVADAPLGLPVGNHVTLCFTDATGAEVKRPYTPVTGPDARGYVDLVVKVYPANTNPKFPAGGAMTQHLEALPIGGTVSAEGPGGRIVYEGRGVLAVKDYTTGTTEKRAAKALAMIAGGSGITPMLALIRSIFSDPGDTTRVSLLYANQSPADVLLRTELDSIAAAHPNFKVAYTVDRVPEGVAWPHAIGFVSGDMIAAALPPPTADVQFLLCGPPGMIKFAVQPAFDKMGVTPAQTLSF